MRINLFGGPGVGKSTLAARLFVWLKEHGHNADLVQEFIKKWAYQGRTLQSFDYVTSFSNQLRREDLLIQAGVKWVITDSPLLLQVAYCRYQFMAGAEGLLMLAREFEAAYPAINLVVNRTVPYQSEGRWETEPEARGMDAHIERQLQAWNVDYTRINTFDDALDVLKGYL